MSSRILVLGGNGFIGSHLVEALITCGARVRVLTRSRCQYTKPVEGVDYRLADFADSVRLSEALVDVDVVVHLISTTVPATANMDPIADIQGNLLTSVRLLQLMRDQGVDRLVYLSSGGTVYGNVQTVPIPEGHDRKPLSSYGIVKVAIENYIEMFSAQHGLHSLILRASNPYGPRQGHLGVQGVIPTFFQRIAANEEITIYGDGSIVRDYIYIDDLVSLMVEAIQANLAGTYNVGVGQGVTIREILNIIQKITGITANIKFLPSRDFDVKKVVLDISKVRNHLDWSPHVPLREGCKRYWEWAKGSTKIIEAD